jgi:hypothetical protein
LRLKKRELFAQFDNNLRYVWLRHSVRKTQAKRPNRRRAPRRGILKIAEGRKNCAALP